MTDVVALLRQLVEIRSVFPDEREIGDFIETYLDRLGFDIAKIYTQGTRANLVATLGDSSSYLAFYGHLDTVPPAVGYEQNPFSVVIEGELARGLGVADMKGGLAAMLALAEWAAVEKLPVKLLFGVDEEDISRGAHDLVRAGTLDEVGFLIVPESGQVLSKTKPFSVGIGRKGRVVLDVEVRGKPAHAALANHGVNAICEAARVIQLIESIKFADHPRLGATQIVIQECQASTDCFSVPDRCRLRVSLLSTPQVSSAEFIRILEDRCDRAGIHVGITYAPRETPFGESYELDQEHPFYKVIRDTIVLPAAVEPELFSSVADENVFAHYGAVPVLTFGPTAGGDHTREEWLSIPSLHRTADAYCRLLTLWSSENYERSGRYRRTSLTPQKTTRFFEYV